MWVKRLIPKGGINPNVNMSLDIEDKIKEFFKFYNYQAPVTYRIPSELDIPDLANMHHVIAIATDFNDTEINIEPINDHPINSLDYIDPDIYRIEIVMSATMKPFQVHRVTKLFLCTINNK